MSAAAVRARGGRAGGNIPASYMRKDHPKVKSVTGHKNNTDYSEDPELRLTAEVASPGLFVGLSTPYGVIDGNLPTVKKSNT